MISLTSCCEVEGGFVLVLRIFLFRFSFGLAPVLATFASKRARWLESAAAVAVSLADGEVPRLHVVVNWPSVLRTIFFESESIDVASFP